MNDEDLVIEDEKQHKIFIYNQIESSKTDIIQLKAEKKKAFQTAAKVLTKHYRNKGEQEDMI
jgi:hypothetical protein